MVGWFIVHPKKVWDPPVDRDRQLLDRRFDPIALELHLPRGVVGTGANLAVLGCLRRPSVLLERLVLPAQCLEDVAHRQPGLGVSRIDLEDRREIGLGLLAAPGAGRDDRVADDGAGVLRV